MYAAGTVEGARSVFKPGSMLGTRFQVVGSLGSGAVGTVLHVLDQELDGESLAIKVLHRHLVADESTYLRFRNEVLLTRQLSHPHILRIYDFDCIGDEHHFVSMELIDGCSLEELMQSRGRRLEIDLVLRVLYQLAQALEYAHRNKIVHRDLKPENVLINASGAVKVADFGLAQSLNGGNGLTRTGETLGTPAYMPPEQFLNKAADERSDIYSFGIMAYELLTGELPFAAPSYFTLAEQHLHAPLPPVAEKRSDVPDWLAITVAQCCQKDPRDRFESIGKVLERIRTKAPETVLNCTESITDLPLRRARAGRVNRRNVRGAQLVLALAAALSVVLVGMQSTVKRNLLMSLLHVEVRHGFEITPIKWLLGVADIDADDPFIIHKAVDKALADPRPFKYVLGAVKHFGDSNLKNAAGDTPLLRVVRHDDYQMVSELASAPGVRLNALSPEGLTPLHLAMTLGHDSLMQVLINHGADPNVGDRNGDSALHAAVERGGGESLRGLLAVRYPYHRFISFDSEGNTVIHKAVAKRDLDSLVQLLERGIPINHRNWAGRTPSMMLAFGPITGKEGEIAKVLVAAKDDLFARDHLGCTAYTLAQRRGLSDVAQLFASHGAQPEPEGDCLLAPE